MKLRMAVLVGVAVVGLGACGSSDDNGKASTPSTAKPVGSGSVDNPATADVVLGACTVDTYGLGHAQVTITNHSSKPSNYNVQVEFVDGTTRVGDAYPPLANNVAPGQVVVSEAVGMAKAGAVCRVANVTRFSAAG